MRVERYMSKSEVISRNTRSVIIGELGDIGKNLRVVGRVVCKKDRERGDGKPPPGDRGSRENNKSLDMHSLPKTGLKLINEPMWAREV